MSAAAIAEAVGVSLQTVFSWESSEAGVNDKPRAGHMNTVHKYLKGVGAINQEVATGMLCDLILAAEHQAEPRIVKKDLGPISGDGISAPC